MNDPLLAAARAIDALWTEPDPVRDHATALGIDLGRSTTALVHRVYDHDRRRLAS